MVVASLLPAGCVDAESTSLERFAADGRLVALSGAEAGASNACFTCHGLDGRGNGAGAPRLAGLDAGYLERQLQAYADGRRHHPQMGWIAGELSAAERKAVAGYYARLAFGAGSAAPTQRQALYFAGDTSRGLQPCAVCHGDRGEGIGPANPPLAGQPAPYLSEQLELWRKGKRRNDPGDVMLRISQLLTPSEISALADFAARLPGNPPIRESAEASRAAHRAGPRNDASGPPLHVPESARAAK